MRGLFRLICDGALPQNSAKPVRVNPASGDPAGGWSADRSRPLRRSIFFEPESFAACLMRRDERGVNAEAQTTVAIGFGIPPYGQKFGS